MLFGDRQTDRQTNKHVDSIDGLRCSRCRERRLNQNNWISRQSSESDHVLSTVHYKL